MDQTLIFYQSNFISFRYNNNIIKNSKQKYKQLKKMRQEISQQSQDNFKVAPLISDEKLSELKYKILSTLTGLSAIGHYQYNDLDQNKRKNTKVVFWVMYFLMPLLIVVPSSVIVEWKFHALAVLIPTVVCPILSILFSSILNIPITAHKPIMTALYSYLWSVHFFISRQLLQNQLIQSSTYSAIIILSLITLLTSATTISLGPVRQFSGSTFDYQQFSIHSTLYVRFYVLVPLLLTQIGLYYSTETGIWFSSLVGIQFSISVGFVLWIFGWISSLYNTVMFFVNNILNCLVFGEQVTHSGSNYRGYTWWVSFLLLAFNVASISFNILLLAVMRTNNQRQDKVVQSQHILIICFAYYTSFITAIIVYFSYRCSQNRRNSMRYNKNNFATSKDNFFFGHKQIFMVIVNLLLPAAICLLAVYVFGQYYDSYSGGKTYEKQTNFLAQKITTYVLLAVDAFCYLAFVGFKQLTRVRSKLGCSINPCCFKDYFVEVERDLFEKITLKVTGALAIVALTLRVQDVEIFSNYILSITPIGPVAHPYIYFFVSAILFPVLVYRSYKRSQTFSHFFHITIIVSFVLTIIDSTSYFYPSIFVVLAFPNFPENALRLLFISPFITPKKLVHKSECLYIVGYLCVNMLTLLIYIATLGTMQFTSIMGLPMYWCVIPSINCQSTKTSNSPTITQNAEASTIKQTLNQVQTSQQVLREHSEISKSTPEHNLYQKIVSEIPFYIFRNKKPGYYLLRISKYILLVQVVMDYYGLFQTVSLIGLQTQQVTTCHAKEGETIDRIIDYTWGDNPQNLKKCQCQDVIKTVIHEQHCIPNTQFTSQNEIQLTGIIQSAQFYQLFKKCLIKSIIFNYNKMLKRSSNNELNSQQTKQAEVLLDDLQNRMSKDKIDEIFPYAFINQNKDNFVFKVRYLELSPSKIIIKKKLPPIKKNQKQKPKKSDLLADFADLIQQNNTSNSIKPNFGEQSKAERVDVDRQDDQVLNKTISEDKKQASDLHMAVIVSAYLSIIGKINYLNTQRLFKMMKKDSSVLSQFQFQGGLDLVANSVGCALKIAIGKQLEGQDQAHYVDFAQYNKNQFFGTLQSPGFSQAIQQNKSDIWTAAYHQTKKMLTIKRLAKNTTPLYMFSLQNHAVQAVWNNLRFQLLFATNDNDQRYSIQTHQYLLRNLLVEGCEQPYGYAGYYSQQFFNL